MKTKILLLLLSVILAFGFVSCDKEESKNDSGASENGDETEKFGIHYVEMNFGDYGKIVIEVDGDTAPITAKNFIDLVNRSFYDGLTIFRAQKNFVIQGGRNDSVTLEPIVGEFESNGHKNDISHLRGVISMARTSNPDSATSQFFITLADSAKNSLDGNYAAFGKVVEGMETVDAIAAALMSCQSDSMGFVSDSDAITIVSAKLLSDYKKPEDTSDKDDTVYDDGGAFDYLTADLSKYITVSGYKDYNINLNIARPKEIDADVAILNILASKKGAVLHNGAAVTSGTITPGDVVNIFYRGYVVGDNGEEIFVDGMCNFGSKNGSGEYVYASLEIGSNQFVPGFEFNLSGKDFSVANQFVRITSGQVSADQVVYVSYTRATSGSSEGKITKASERIVLADGKEKIDAKYGVGFYDKLLTLTVGAADNVSFDCAANTETYNYSNFKVDFATTCEKPGNYILVDCYFPYDYGTATLQNKNARFEVYVQSVTEYEETKLTNEFVENNLFYLGITAADLDMFDGDRVSQLRQYIKKLLDDDYQDTYNAKLEEAMWKHYLGDDVSVVKQYPKVMVDLIYNEYYNDVLYQFEQSGGVVTGSWGMTITCETVDQYAIYYLGLQYAENQDWKAYLRTLAKSLVEERLVLYYIIKAENLVPTPDTLASKKAEIEKEYLDSYIEQYCHQYNIDKSKYSEADWAKFVTDRTAELHEYYDDAYFVENAYYQIAVDAMLTWPTVTTLDK